MIAAGTGGVFLNVTTNYAPHGSGFVAPSAAAKAGVHALTGSLAAEWGARHGIRFVNLSPGPSALAGTPAPPPPTVPPNAAEPTTRHRPQSRRPAPFRASTPAAASRRC